MSVAAGIPYAVDEGVDKEIDLNEYLVEHPNSTFFAQVRCSADEDSIFADGDILVVDSSRLPKAMDYVVTEVSGNRSVKVYHNDSNGEYLQNYEGATLPLRIDPFIEFKILGVVTKQIHAIK